jgi:hypothetical protein
VKPFVPARRASPPACTAQSRAWPGSWGRSARRPSRVVPLNSLFCTAYFTASQNQSAEVTSVNGFDQGAV